MEKRPRIKPELTIIDKALEIAGWIVLLMTWVMVIIDYSKLPDIIPIHYNIKGEIDGYGEKSNILTLPLVATIMFVGMTILNKYPHIFNYLVNITEENALRQYTGATRMIRYLKLIIVMIFGFIMFKTVQNTNGLGIGFSLLMLGGLFVPLIYFIIKSFRGK